MDRRFFLKSVLVAGVSSLGTGLPDLSVAASRGEALQNNDEYIKDYLTKIKNFNNHFNEDVILTEAEMRLLKSVTARLRRVQSTVGYANFSLISFDYALRIARNYSRVGEFTRAEAEFIERIFYTKASDYGFFGEKVSLNLTESISSRDTQKISGSGHYVFRGQAERFYDKVKRDVGDSLVLTSGVRGIVKQMYLFFNKALDSNGNLSMASRSLAPPGHSFHGIGDFDVGKRGFGYRNFTEDFASTDEFKRLTDLGYIRIRYHESNPFGVRFEPWHIKVV